MGDKVSAGQPAIVIVSNGIQVKASSPNLNFVVADAVPEQPHAQMLFSTITKLPDQLGAADRALSEALARAGLTEHVGLTIESLEGVSPGTAQFEVPLPEADQAMRLIGLKMVGAEIQIVLPDSIGPNLVGKSQTFSFRLNPQDPRPGSYLSYQLTSLKLSTATAAVVKFFKFALSPEDIADDVLQAVVGHFERKLKTEQLVAYSGSTGLQPLSDELKASLINQQSLLLVHGIFSSINGGFKHLFESSDLMNELMNEAHYGPRIIGWDHWTVSESIFNNAMRLIDALPADTRFNVVCHSRGGLVVRCLLEHPNAVAALQDKNIRIVRAVFVAGAYAGDMLASSNNEILTLLNAFIALARLVPNPIVDDIALVFRVAVGLAHGIQRMPGIEELSPGGELLTQTAWGESPNASYFYVRANYALQGKLGDGLIDGAVKMAIGDYNDLVVPFAGAALPKAPNGIAASYDFPPGGGTQDLVHHLNFFAQPIVRDFLHSHLVETR